MNRQIVVTAIILVVTIVFFELTGIDIRLQDHLFNFDHQQWLLDRNDRLWKFLFYDGIKRLFIGCILLLVLALLFFRKRALIRRNLRGLIIVCLSAITVPLVVGLLKDHTNVPCPRNLVHYGGDYPYVTVLTPYPEDFDQEKKIRCYPAGHASGGFSLLSLAFLFGTRKKQALALAGVMLVGWSTGIYKMLIGDHFLSHTVVTMILAWLIILIIVRSVDRFLQQGAPVVGGEGLRQG